jgi:hypothetical protein
MTPSPGEAAGEIVETDAGSELAAAPDVSGIDLASAPLTWKALVRIADTDFVPRALRGNPSAVLACVFTGREVGLDPMASLRLVDIIDGRPALSAQLTVALIRTAGHRIVLVEETPDSVTVEGIRREDTQDRMTITYRLEDAAQAGLVLIDDQGRPRARSRNGKRLPWETYTPDLLWARAVQRLSRRFFPDVTAAPSRTAIATFQATELAEADSPASMSISDAVFEVGKLLEGGVAHLSTAVEAEVFIRRLCRLAVTSEIVSEDPLSEILAGHGARHLSELRAAEVHEAARAAHLYVSQEYSAAVGRDLTSEDVEPVELDVSM